MAAQATPQPQPKWTVETSTTDNLASTLNGLDARGLHVNQITHVESASRPWVIIACPKRNQPTDLKKLDSRLGKLNDLINRWLSHKLGAESEEEKEIKEVSSKQVGAPPDLGAE